VNSHYSLMSSALKEPVEITESRCEGLEYSKSIWSALIQGYHVETLKIFFSSLCSASQVFRSVISTHLEVFHTGLSLGDAVKSISLYYVVHLRFSGQVQVHLYMQWGVGRSYILGCLRRLIRFLKIQF
jgi:hypothetical protein